MKLSSNDPTLAFLAQPVQVIAQEGEDFAATVIQTLRRWAHSGHGETVRAERAGGVFVISPQRNTPWNLVVISHQDADHLQWANVCALEFGLAEAAADRFAPLLGIDNLFPVMEVGLDRVEPSMFAPLAISRDLGRVVTAHHGTAADVQGFGRILSVVDHTGRRWASSNARSHFKEVLDRARGEPQIVERGDEDMIVFSRTYLEELIDPTGARAMAARYRERALSAEGLVEPVERPIGNLEPLPELGAR